MDVCIIGTGKLAHQLAFAISRLKNHFHLKTICGRSKAKAQTIIDHSSCNYVKNIESIPSHDLIIIAVKDDAIEEVSSRLAPDNKTLIVHTSGIKDMSLVNQHNNHGIFYPLYSFFNKEESSLKGVPFLVQSNSVNSTKTLKNLGELLSGSVYKIDSEDKKQLHIAAVFANNFSNFMMTNAMDLLEDKNIDKEILLPIIQQSCRNWTLGEAKDNQSGPAVRRDQNTINTHLDKLESKDQKALYNLISKAIQNYYS